MLTREECKWLIFEGYLSQLDELDVTFTQRRNTIQMFVMSLLSPDQNIMELSPNTFLKIATLFPVASKQILPTTDDMMTLDVPYITPQEKNKIPEVWQSLTDDVKQKIYAIAHIIKNKMAGN